MSFSFIRRTFSAFLLTLLSVLTLPGQLSAQIATTGSETESVKPAVDPFGRTSPRGTVEGYLKAIRADDFEKAAMFLDLSNIPENERRRTGIKRAEELIKVLDRDGSVFEVNRLSTAPEGSVSDELEANVDQVGMLDRSVRDIPLLVHRVKDENDLDIWLFEPRILNRVPFLLRVSDEGLLDKILPQRLKDNKIATVSTGHWIAVFLLIFAALVIGITISRMLLSLLRRLLDKRTDIPGRGILSSIQIPLGVLIGISLYRVIVSSLGVQVVARDYVNWIAIIASWFALAWLGMRLIDGIAEIVRYSMSRSNRLTSVAVIMLGRRMAKAVIIALAVITVLDVLGVDVTTGLAALGIGGLALALGAQKTIENLVGSITVVADKPVNVGDFCKFGGVMGTVEDIGIRSTRVRTLDRTIVTVPNGAFASMEIENYSLRDEFKFETILTMRYESTPDQIRFLLIKLRELLADHATKNMDPARVKFVGLGSHSLDIHIFCYIKAKSYAAFLDEQERLLLEIMDIVAQSGTDFAFPSQTLYLGEDQELSPTKAKQISKELAKLKGETTTASAKGSKKKTA